MKDNITYDDFAKLDLRVGEILEASAPDWSKKLLQFKVDMGTEIGIRTLFSGIREWYQPEDLIGKKAVFVANLEPKKMGDSESQGMMIMADTATQPILFFIDPQIENGTIIR